MSKAIIDKLVRSLLYSQQAQQVDSARHPAGIRTLSSRGFLFESKASSFEAGGLHYRSLPVDCVLAY